MQLTGVFSTGLEMIFTGAWGDGGFGPVGEGGGSFAIMGGGFWVFVYCGVALSPASLNIHRVKAGDR